MPSCCARYYPESATTPSIASSAPSSRRKSLPNQALRLWKRFLGEVAQLFLAGIVLNVLVGYRYRPPPAQRRPPPHSPYSPPRSNGGRAACFRGPVSAGRGIKR